jgi:predicted RNase H-like HicB family nuclease
MSPALAYTCSKRSGDTMTTFTIWIHPLEDGKYLADCPELGGCSTIGTSIRQTELKMYDVVDSCLVDIDDYSLSFIICIPNEDTISALEEAEQIISDTARKHFTTVEELFADLNSDEV